MYVRGGEPKAVVAVYGHRTAAAAARRLGSVRGGGKESASKEERSATANQFRQCIDCKQRLKQQKHLPPPPLLIRQLQKERGTDSGLSRQRLPLLLCVPHRLACSRCRLSGGIIC